MLTLNQLRSKLENMHKKNAMLLRNKVKRETEAEEVLRMQEGKIEQLKVQLQQKKERVQAVHEKGGQMLIKVEKYKKMEATIGVSLKQAQSGDAGVDHKKRALAKDIAHLETLLQKEKITAEQYQDRVRKAKNNELKTHQHTIQCQLQLKESNRAQAGYQEKKAEKIGRAAGRGRGEGVEE